MTIAKFFLCHLDLLLLRCEVLLLLLLLLLLLSSLPLLHFLLEVFLGLSPLRGQLGDLPPLPIHLCFRPRVVLPLLRGLALMIVEVLLQLLELCLDLVLPELADHLYGSQPLLSHSELVRFLLGRTPLPLHLDALIHASSIPLPDLLLSRWHRHSAGGVHEAWLAEGVPWAALGALIVIELLVVDHDGVVCGKVAPVVLRLVEPLLVFLLAEEALLLPVGALLLDGGLKLLFGVDCP